MNDTENEIDKFESLGSELDKIERIVSKMWEDLRADFPIEDRSSHAYIVQWNRIHAYREVWSNYALEMPTARRIADTAVDAKTTLRVVEIILERQLRLEAKIDHLAGYVKTLPLLMVAMLVFLVVSFIIGAP